MAEWDRREQREILEAPQLTNLPPNLEDTGDADVETDSSSTYTTPRWAKLFGIILIVVLVLLLLIQHLVFAGMGGHL